MAELQRLKNLTKEQLDRLGSEIGEAFAAEDGGIVQAIGKDACRTYIKICVEIYYKSGHLYTVDHSGYLSFYAKDDQPKLRYHFLMAGMMIKRLGIKKLRMVMRAMKGWVGYEKIYKKQNYMILSMIAIPIQYQGQGRMKPLIQHAFDAAEKRGFPCVLDTDTALKKEKYLRCGMRLKHEQKLESGTTVYVLEK